MWLDEQAKFGSGLNSGADLGGAYVFSLQGLDHLPTQRVSLCTILRYPYLLTDPKIFLKAPLAPLYTNCEGEARAENTQFFGQNFQPIFQNVIWIFFCEYKLFKHLIPSFEDSDGPFVFGVVFSPDKVRPFNKNRKHLCCRRLKI